MTEREMLEEMRRGLIMQVKALDKRIEFLKTGRSAVLQKVDCKSA